MSERKIQFTVTTDPKVGDIMGLLFNPRRQPRYAMVTVEELLLLLMEVPEVRAATLAWKGDADTIEERLEEYIDHHLPPVVINPKHAGHEEDLPPNTPIFEDVMGRALLRAQEGGRNLTVIDLFLAILDCTPDQCLSSAILRECGLKSENITNRQRDHWIKKSLSLSAAARTVAAETPPPATDQPSALHPLLSDVRSKVRQWQPLVGRAEALESLYQSLLCRDRRGAIVVGESGVGKTRLLEGLVQSMVAGTAPESLCRLPVYAINAVQFLAGAGLRGDLEKRVQSIQHWFETRKEGLLLLDDLSPWIHLVSQGQGDVLGMLVPLLQQTNVRVLATLSVEKMRICQERIPTFANLVQTIELHEPDASLNRAILQQHADSYGRHHKVQYPEATLERIVRLTERHLPQRRFPEKGIRILDGAGAAHALLAPEDQTGIVDIALVERQVARAAGLPEEHLRLDDNERLRLLPSRLATAIVGQDTAIQAVVAAVRRGKVGLGRGGKKKPIGTFLFAGPTGVGKTELATQLAEGLGVPLLRFDMSEYAEAHTISRLVGAPPGYIGHAKGGQLTEQIARNPHAVLLLDEIEKANPAIFNLLLQVMDKGVLTDAQGTAVDCRNLVLILTSNVGATDAARPVVGLAASRPQQTHRQEEALERTFTPEFRNRLDGIIQFQPLTPDAMLAIVDHQLKALAADLAERRQQVSWGLGLREWLARQGYSAKFGARPLHRLLEQEVATALAEHLLEQGDDSADWTIDRTETGLIIDRQAGH